MPHAIELMQADYDILFTLLRTQKEIEILINPFVNALIFGYLQKIGGELG